MLDLLKPIIKLLLLDSPRWLNLLFDIFQRFPLFKNLPGLYEVLSHEVTLELKDGKGKKAIYRKQQQVKFLQNNVIAYYDMAWGDGDIFADYQCSPGIPVDRFRDGYRYNILISLRETKNRGDTTTFNIKRVIMDGFTQSDELFQTDVNHRMHHLSISVIFPKSRLPKDVMLLELNTNRSKRLDTHNLKKLPGGRYKYMWETDSPRLFESYVMRWKW